MSNNTKSINDQVLANDINISTKVLWSGFAALMSLTVGVVAITATVNPTALSNATPVASQINN